LKLPFTAAPGRVNRKGVETKDYRGAVPCTLVAEGIMSDPKRNAQISFC
jgi:hypothetical protein